MRNAKLPHSLSGAIRCAPILAFLFGGILVGNDCNQNGVDDQEEIAKGKSQDCNLNSIPDECDISPPGLGLSVAFQLGALGPVKAGLARWTATTTSIFSSSR